MLKRILLAGLAGYGLSLAFEPLAWAWLIPIALALFGYTLLGVRKRSGFLIGLVFGGCFYYPHIGWMRIAIGADAWVGLAALETLFYGLLGALAPVLMRLRWWPAWLAACWAATESIRSTWPFSGMPWGRLSFGVVDTPVANALPYLGTTLLGFLLALSGFMITWTLLRPTRREQGIGLATLGVLAVGLTLPTLVPLTFEPTGTARVAVVQGDVPGPGDDILWDHRQVTANHVEATERLADRVEDGSEERPDFVLWPENSTAVDPFRDGSMSDDFNAVADRLGVPILVGALVDEGDDHLLNQGIVWNPGTGPGDRYTKWHPVPYGEYIPFRKYISGTVGRLAVIPRDMLGGTRTTPLEVGDLKVGDLICFDVAYEDSLYHQVRNGAELLTVQTSNTSFIFTDQIDQQFAMTRLRALETGRSLAVASPNGISGVIRPDGSVQALAPERETWTTNQEIDLFTQITPAVRMGVAPAWLLAGVTAVGWALGVVTYRRKPGTAHDDQAPEDPERTDLERQRG